jgi:hypothetical protein
MDGAKPPFRGCTFIITEAHLKTFFSQNPAESIDMEFLADYCQYYSGEIYVLGGTYGKLKGQVDPNSLKYLNSLFKDGSCVTGLASFGSEDLDLMFLAGMLTIKDGDRDIIIVHESKDLFNKADHSRVLTQLGTLGLNSMQLRVTGLTSIVDVTKALDKEYMSRVSSFSE